VSVPALTPLILELPDVVLTMLAKALLKRQVPPNEVSEKVEVSPTHRVVAPVIEPTFGKGRMVTLIVVESAPQPLVIINLMVAVPSATPVTIPDVLPTVANVGCKLLHLPPTVVSDKRVVSPPAQSVVTPVIAPATGGITLTA
jgi:hypothetical protein